MTPEEEKQLKEQVSELVDKVDDLHGALLGTLRTPGGALKVINNLAEDFYSPSDPSESVPHRLKDLENARREEKGWRAGAAAAGGILGGVLWWAFERIFGRNP